MQIWRTPPIRMKYTLLAIILYSPINTASGAGNIFGKIIDFGQETIESVGEAAGEIMTDFTESLNGESGSHKTSTDRDSLRSYSREKKYILQGAVLGGGTTVSINCLNNMRKGEKCTENAVTAAAIGITLGAIGGYYTASKEQNYEDEEQQLAKQLEAAKIELSQAKSATEASKKIVKLRRSELSHLKKQAEKDKSANESLKSAITEAKLDIESMKASIVRMEGEREAIKTSLEENKDEKTRLELNSIHAALAKQRDQLNAQISQLQSAIIDAQDTI